MIHHISEFATLLRCFRVGSLVERSKFSRVFHYSFFIIFQQLINRKAEAALMGGFHSLEPQYLRVGVLDRVFVALDHLLRRDTRTILIPFTELF